MAKRILMIEDSPSLVMTVGDRLVAEGYEFASAENGILGLEKARHEDWDLILVDLMLPGLDGEAVLRRLRGDGCTTPLVVLSAKDAMESRVAVLKNGADDFIAKPFSFEELLARIEAHLRRGPGAAISTSQWLDTSKPDFVFGDFVLKFRMGRLYRGTESIDLPQQGFRLLCFFAENAGVVLSTEQILSEAWGYDTPITSRTVYVHVALLRRLLRSEACPDGHISTVRGLGYVFEP